ncbi:hypothetical protein Ade02nite_80500 [Paractinoplanes deccanensis]|uniref:Uncharacterized protein n=1 Tax=Paractinoplanes deccanensis TaxID=113561 RepID=A0ABQ3YHB9_9ACTN|nr:hypothetical protein Ade02nite_80500 [Actinoplanes deccanensis]
MRHTGQGRAAGPGQGVRANKRARGARSPGPRNGRAIKGPAGDHGHAARRAEDAERARDMKGLEHAADTRLEGCGAQRTHGMKRGSWNREFPAHGILGG